MKKTDTPMNIWKDISGGTQLPHVLKIKLIDALTKRSGHLYIFDLLHPRFLPPTLETKKGAVIYNSFEKIRYMVDLVISTEDTCDTYTMYNNEVWTSLLTPFICGFGKLLVLGYLNECPKMHKVETLMALDFIAKMKSIKSKSLPNDATLKPCDIEAMADNERKYNESQMTIQEMKIYINDILAEKSAREMYIAELENKIKDDSLKEENMKLQKKLNSSHQELQLLGQLFKRAAVDAANRMVQIKTFAYQRLANLKQEKMKETEALEKLQYENSQLVIKIGLVEDELSREYAIAIKEKNDLRAYLKILRDSVDNVK
ncbi:hypothetical protein BDF21DRAFT_431681 [Thamnidium elegans]|nr:hypothetical protein BDF21DRAFT_431681 [Thamnidium elegans]